MAEGMRVHLYRCWLVGLFPFGDSPLGLLGMFYAGLSLPLGSGVHSEVMDTLIMIIIMIMIKWLLYYLSAAYGEFFDSEIAKYR